MGALDVIRWRRNRGLTPITGSAATVLSAAGRSAERYAPRPLAASASVFDPTSRSQSLRARAARQGWQAEAMSYYDGVGELRYAVQTSANAVSRLRLFPAVQTDPKAPPTPLEEVGTDVMPASVVAAAIEDMGELDEPGHGLSAMQHAQSIHKQLVGEYYVVGLPMDPETGEESWSVRSIDEVIVDTDGKWWLRDAPPGFMGYDELPLPLGEDCYVARCWDPHPRFRRLAHSQMRPLLESLEELLLASRMIRSTLRSRIAGNGVLLVPDELELLGIDPTNNDAEANPFFEELTKAMLTPIQAEGDASEVVPMVVRGPAAVLSELRHLTLDRPFDQYAMSIRGELIRRIAIGIDWPPELLLGVGDVSHWAQWFVDESSFRYHYEPQGISAVRQWTQGYAQPMLLSREWDAATEEKAKQVVWWYDPTALLTHPDRTKDAIQLYTMDVLSDEALLQAAGFDPETDKPSQEEFLIRLMTKARTLPPNVVEAIIHRIDPNLPIPADKDEPGVGPGTQIEPPIEAPPAAPPGGNGGPPERGTSAEQRIRVALESGGWREQIRALSALTADANPSGAMLALYPTAEQAAALAVDGGEPAEDIHVTLAYLGAAAELGPEQVDACRTIAASIAGLHAPLEGTFGGVARFTATGSSDGLDPVVATVDVQGLVAMRNMLCEHLAAAGVPMPSEHGYTPHATLAYVAPDAASPVDRLDPVPAAFGTISLVLGSQRTDYPLQGIAEPIVAAPAPDRSAEAALRRRREPALSRRLTDIDRTLRERIRTAADAAIRRQLEKANARLKSRLNGRPELKAAIQDVPATHFAHALGAEALASAGIDTAELLGGEEYAQLREQVGRWVSASQRQALSVARRIAPIPQPALDAAMTAQAQHAAAAWEFLQAGLADASAELLFDPDPDAPPVGEADDGYLIDSALIRGVVAIAGGFGSAEGSQGLNPDGTPVDPSEMLGGIGTGLVIGSALAEAGAEIEEWMWVYGASARPFEPHVALDGVTYTSHEDDQLANTEGWPETDYFYVGDHDGCDCDEVPSWVVAEPGDDTEDAEQTAEVGANA